MEIYRSYLNAFNAFITATYAYRYAKKVTELSGVKKDEEKAKKDLQQKARKLLAEYNRAPVELQLPVVREKIDKALTL